MAARGDSSLHQLPGSDGVGRIKPSLEHIPGHSLELLVWDYLWPALRSCRSAQLGAGRADAAASSCLHQREMKWGRDKTRNRLEGVGMGLEIRMRRVHGLSINGS